MTEENSNKNSDVPKNQPVEFDEDEITDELDELWSGASEFFYWIGEDELPSLKSYRREGSADEWFGGIVEDERLEQLEGGDDPTEEEISDYREAWLEKLKYGDVDADSISAYAVSYYTDESGKSYAILLSGRGYSFSGVSYDFVYAFEDLDSAMAYVKSKGLVILQ